MKTEFKTHPFKTHPEEKTFPFIALYNRCGEKIPVVVCRERNNESYYVYFPDANYEVLQGIYKSEVTRLPSGSQIILTQS